MLRDWLHPRVSEGVKLVLKPACDSEIFLARELEEIAKRIDRVPEIRALAIGEKSEFVAASNQRKQVLWRWRLDGCVHKPQ